MNEQTIKQIAMAKEAIKKDSRVIGSLREAREALYSAMEDIAEDVGTLDMLKVTEETIAIGAINQLYENVSLLLAE